MESNKAKRQVSRETFFKSKRTFEKDHQSMSWLRCTLDEKAPRLVETLWCDVCRRLKDTICSVKNFSKAWIEGSTNHKTSNIVEHARSDQHKGAMMRLRQEQARKRQEPITAYSNIARRITVMDNATKERIKRKFDISFVLAKENLAFTKYPLIYKLEQRHGVDLGQAYQGRERVSSNLCALYCTKPTT